MQAKLLHLLLIKSLVWSLACDSYHQMWQVGVIQSSLQKEPEFTGWLNQHAMSM